MEPYGSPYLGLDQAAFWKQMECCFAEVIAPGAPDRGVPVPEDLIPTIAVDPAPAEWPDPVAYLDDEHD
jgi:hypothetical protein